MTDDRQLEIEMVGLFDWIVKAYIGGKRKKKTDKIDAHQIKRTLL